MHADQRGHQQVSRRSELVLSSVLASSLVACSVDGALTGGFRCDDGRCPSGLVCEQGVCITTPVDASDGGGTGGASSCGTVGLFADDFEDGELNPLAWTAGGTVSEQGGDLVLELAADATEPVTYGAGPSLDLREGTLTFSLTAAGGETTVAGFYDDGDQGYEFQVDHEGRLRTAIDTVVREDVSFDLATQHELRFRYEGDDLVWEAGDGETWSPIDRVAPGRPLRWTHPLVAMSGNGPAATARFGAITAQPRSDGWCPVSALPLRFDGDDEGGWTRTGDCTFVPDGFALGMVLPATTTGCGVRTTRPYDLRNRAVTVGVVPGTGAATRFEVVDASAQNWVRVDQRGAQMFLSVRADGEGVLDSAMSYASTAQRFWRIRQDGSRVRIEVSSDDVTYEQVGSVEAPGFAGAAVDVALSAELTDTASMPVLVSFDELEGS